MSETLTPKGPISHINELMSPVYQEWAKADSEKYLEAKQNLDFETMHELYESYLLGTFLEFRNNVEAYLKEHGLLVQCSYEVTPDFTEETTNV